MIRVIYFLRAEGVDRIKIGSTTEFERRLGEIQALCPVPLTLIGTIEGEFEDEFAFHDRVREYRTHAEWFRETPELLREIDTAVKIHQAALDEVARLLVRTIPRERWDEMSAILHIAGYRRLAETFLRFGVAP